MAVAPTVPTESVYAEFMNNIDFEKERAELQLVPVFKRMIVKEFEVERVGHIIVPSSAREGEMATNCGVILAVGDEVNAFAPGEVVYYGRHSGAWITIKKKRYRIINQPDILGYFKTDV